MTAERELEVRDVPEPRDPPARHLVVRIEAAAINRGDKTFLQRPEAAGPAPARSGHDVWGASAAGEVVAAGPEVPDGYLGRKVAVYRSIGGGPDTVGLWCEAAQIPFTACLRLPEGADARDWSGSLANIVTAAAFLETVATDGHRAVIATAGNSATGRAPAALARRRGVPALVLVRSAAATAELERHGVADILVVATDADLEPFGRRASELGGAAVFDGIGGGGLGRLLPHLPHGSTVYASGFLAGAEPVSFPSALLMAKDLTLRRFSNFATNGVRDVGSRLRLLRALEPMMDDTLFFARVGRTFAWRRSGRRCSTRRRPEPRPCWCPDGRR